MVYVITYFLIIYKTKQQTQYKEINIRPALNFVVYQVELIYLHQPGTFLRSPDGIAMD